MKAPAEIVRGLVAAGFATDPAELEFTPLSGGVSSDIWRVTGGCRPICVKRARGRLAVKADWQVPIERNHFEAEFLRVVGDEVPGLAPELLAEDQASSMIVLPYLDPAEWHLWKPQLMTGHVDIDAARSVGTHLGRLSRVTRDRLELSRRFETTALFRALRLDPYLLECARKHPDLAPALVALSEATASRREALVHGDVSPKNILVDDTSATIILDAECAWYGDPAFDLAFVLNHLVLKSIRRPGSANAIQAAITALLDARAASDAPTHAMSVQQRATALLPALLLARIDGKSPVEYLTNPAQLAAIRKTARRFLMVSAAHPMQIATAAIEDQNV